MSDNRKYYYLKLKENYFDEDAIVLLESMQDGILYSNILLKLYLKSLKNGGKLQLDENIPYTAQMIATITRQQVGTVERALQIFMKLGLVEPLQNGALYTYTTNLLSNGAQPKDVQELLGHSDVSTTMNVYAHATREAKRTSARLLDKVAGND